MNEGRHCLFTDYGNAESIAGQTIRLLKDERLRNGMSEANRMLSTHFRAEEVAQEFLDIYNHILGREDFEVRVIRKVKAELESII